MPVGHSYVFFGDMSTDILCPFLKWVSCLFKMPLILLLLAFSLPGTVGVPHARGLPAVSETLLGAQYILAAA